MALPGRQQWSDGDVPTAAELDGLTGQTVHVYADAAARDAAHSQRAAQVGQIVVTLDDGVLWYWRGAAWERALTPRSLPSHGRHGQIPHRSPIYADAETTGLWTLRDAYLAVESGAWE